MTALLEQISVRSVTRAATVSGWSSVVVRRGLGVCAATFEVSMGFSDGIPIAPGDEIVVRAGNTQVCRGYVDTRSVAWGQTHTLTFSGREPTADLVDCSVEQTPSSWANATLGSIVEQIAAQRDIAVIDKSQSDATFPQFRLRPSETGWSAIERACRMRGVLAHGDGNGHLLIEVPGRPDRVSQLGAGSGILDASMDVSVEDRFQLYVVRGARPGNDLVFGAAASHIEGIAKDPKIRATRMLEIVAEGSVDAKTATERAQWEATIRAARSARAKLVMQGWRRPNAVGDLWVPGVIVPASIPQIGLDGMMMVDRVEYRQGSDGGTRCTLELVRIDAYAIAPAVAEKTDPLTSILDEAEGAEDDVEDADE